MGGQGQGGGLIEIYVKRAIMFFDRQPVIKAMDRAKRRSLARAGGFIRQTARRSMRRAGPKVPPSSPGEPPRARAGQIRDLLFFGWDQGTESVVIGPETFTGRSSGYIVPELHEHGGTVRLRSRRRGASGQQMPKAQSRMVTFAPRPFMDPALKTALDKGVIPEAFRNSITGP